MASHLLYPVTDAGGPPLASSFLHTDYCAHRRSNLLSESGSVFVSAKGFASAARNYPRRCTKKVPVAATAAHAEGSPDRRRGGTGRPASATSQTTGRSRRHCLALRR